MRNMSFAITTEQIKRQTKTVTRRMGWRSLKPGDLLQAVVKSQGLKKGEKVMRLCVLRVIATSQEQLNAITEAEVAAEGFPDMSAREFVAIFCATHKGCTPATVITRIKFSYHDQTIKTA